MNPMALDKVHPYATFSFISQAVAHPRGEWDYRSPNILKYDPRDFCENVMKLIGAGVRKLFCSVRRCDVYEKYFN